ncbi:MAG: RluA family pseudouridine synthase [Treponema sp.]|nr:RluA family pseudouridine synthase [Treponema sp.]
MPAFSHTVTEIIPGGMRLDLYIAENLGLLSRSQIKARELKASINGKEVKISRLVKSGDALELFWKEADPVNIIPEDIPLDILYEDERSVVINKIQGMVVHPGAGNRSGTLANALYWRKLNAGVFSATEPAAGRDGIRPGIVHRLDKDTSGVIIAAYDDETLAFLAGQFKTRKTKKTYIAIVNGIPKEKKGRIETFIARDPKDRKRFAVSGQGKIALTYYSVIKTWKSHSLVLLRLKTGRTHQLRVHMRYIGCPIAGDPLYGFTDTLFPNASLMLHAKKLAIVLPGETEQRIFKAPLPQRFIGMIQRLNGLDKTGSKF